MLRLYSRHTFWRLSSTKTLKQQPCVVQIGGGGSVSPSDISLSRTDATKNQRSVALAFTSTLWALGARQPGVGQQLIGPAAA
jgi:hypothetical protein